MKKQILLLPFLLFCLLSHLDAQIPVSHGFNYYDVNQDAFINTPFLFKQFYQPHYSTAEIGYWATSIKLAQAASNLYNNSLLSPPDKVIGGYRLSRHNYFQGALGQEVAKMVVLRPDDNVNRPTVLLTHGGKTSGAGAFRLMSLGVTDLVQRGYAVMYYQSGIDKVAHFAAALDSVDITGPCSDPAFEPMDKACLEQRAYFKVQCGYAAAQYAQGMKSTLHLNTDQLFLAGFSGGAMSSLLLALSDTTNYKDSLFYPQGHYNRFSKFPNLDFEVKAVATMGSGLIVNPIAGPMIGPEDAGVRFLMLHGQDDAAVKPDHGPLFWSIPFTELRGVGFTLSNTLDLVSTLQANGSTGSKAILNCSGCHEVFSYPCTYCDDCDGNAVLTSSECYLWRKQDLNKTLNQTPFQFASFKKQLAYYLNQIHDIGLLTSHFFHEDIPVNGFPASPSLLVSNVLQNNAPSAVNPVDYPYHNGFANGHFQISTKCLVQNNAALFFNQKGDNGNFPSAAAPFGDYIKIPWASQQGNDLLSGDFTVEIRFRTKNQTGRGTLFSYLDQYGRGIEIYLRPNGKLTLHYRNGFQLIDNSNLNDGVCHHIAVTRSGKDYHLWVDGVQTAARLNQNKPNSNLPSDLRIGNTKLALKQWGFNGIMTEVRLWDKVVNMTAEVDAASLNNNTPGLVANWHFTDGQTQVIVSNANGNLLTGTLGESAATQAYDPKWLENDEACECNVGQFGPGSGKVAANTTLNPSRPLEVVVTPNPVQDMLSVRFPENYQGQVQLQLLDAQAKILFQNQLSLVSGNRPFSIEMANLPAGIYFLTIRNGEQMFTQKLLKK
ncbi:MAG TPA: T9SS type A sorting domain-containing protein [Bacteroidetes bacterium]|nr:T9SS type A sorting domain-containing protein [Bacteroidota bacterium]